MNEIRNLACTAVITGILFLVGLGSAVAGQRQRIVTIFDALPFDGVTGPATSAVVPTAGFGHVTMVSYRTVSSAPDYLNFGVMCFFTMEKTTDPSTTLSVAGFSGGIGKDGFSYNDNILPPPVPSPVLGPYLVCSMSQSNALGASAKLTLKAVFSK
jgi:hypothetical protein